MNFTRRRFLISAAAPYILRPSAVSANEGPGLLAIGVGNRGSGIALAAARLGRIVGCCEVDTARAEAFLAKLGKQQPARPEIYKDYRRALERKDVDAVTIGTPDHWHAAILIAALQGRQGRLLREAAHADDRRGQEDLRRGPQDEARGAGGHAAAQRIRPPLPEGRSHRARRAAGKETDGQLFHRRGPRGRAVRRRRSALHAGLGLLAGPGAQGRLTTEKRCHATFRWWFDYSGGKLTDWGAHHVDIAMWALGVENTGPVEIEGQGEFPLGREATLAPLVGKRAAPLPNAYNTPTKFKITLRFANGNTVIVQDGPGNGIRLEGEKDQIWVSRKELTGELIKALPAGALDPEVLKLYGGKQPGSHMGNFVDCMRERTTPISDVFTHHRAVSACHLCNIAMLTGRKLRWDPARENFIGDREASALLSRKQRKPYVIEA